MKKLFILVAVFPTALSMNVNAQGRNFDTVAMKARYLERTKSPLIEKTNLSEEQANKVLEINWQSRSKMRGTRNMSADDRKKLFDDLQADARFVGGAGAGRQHDAFGAAVQRVAGGDLVIADHAHLRPQLPQVMEEVVGEGVVVIDQQDHRRRVRLGRGYDTGFHPCGPTPSVRV